MHGYEEWGVRMLHRLNGIFALAIWDSREHQLLLARDRFGAKPLYLRQDPRGLMFGSEIKAILALAGESARLSFTSLIEYMAFQNTYGEDTLFEGITMLPAGTWLRVSDDGTIKRGTYYDPIPASEPTPGNGRLAEALGAALQRAVDRQLMSDVPVGAYLSGGMDSASLVVLAGRTIPHIHTFTAGFDVADASPLEVAADERAGRRNRRPRRRHRALRGGFARRRPGAGAPGTGLAPGGPACRAPATRTTSSLGWRRSS